MSGGQLGGGPSGGKGYFPAAFEESKARARERRLDRQHGGTKSLGARSRGIGLLLVVAFAVALMSYAVWESLGAIAGAAAAVLLVLGAVGLWRFWR